MRRLLLATTLTVLPQVTSAQTWRTDPNTTRLAWGNANVVVRGDTMSGVQIWAGTSRVLNRTAPRRDYAARFEPDAIFTWLPYAEKLLEASSTPRDPASHLRTPALLGTDGSRVVLDRAQKGGKWAPRTDIVFVVGDSTAPWSISADKGATKAFLQALLQHASSSFYRASVSAVLLEPNPADSATSPWPLATAVVQYPNARRREGQSGDVWLTFIVRPDSTVDPSSYTVLVSDGVDFTAAAVRAVGSVRYRPATRLGVPVAALAFQRVSFLMAH